MDLNWLDQSIKWEILICEGGRVVDAVLRSKMNVRMGYPQYNIVLSHLKDRHLLMEDLERRIV